MFLLYSLISFHLKYFYSYYYNLQNRIISDILKNIISICTYSNLLYNIFNECMLLMDYELLMNGNIKLGQKVLILQQIPHLEK